MAMYVDTRYDNFMATITVTSDTIDAIDLYDPGFRIDFTNQFTAAANATKIAELIDTRTGYEKTDGPAIAAAEAELEALRTKLRYASTAAEIASLNQQCQIKTVEINYLKKNIWMCEHGVYQTCTDCFGSGFTPKILNKSMEAFSSKGVYVYQIGSTELAESIREFKDPGSEDDPTIPENPYFSDTKTAVFSCTEKHTSDDYPIYITRFTINRQVYDFRMDPIVKTLYDEAGNPYTRVFYEGRIDDGNLHLAFHNPEGGEQSMAGEWNVNISCHNEGDEKVSFYGFELMPDDDIRVVGGSSYLPESFPQIICHSCKGKCLNMNAKTDKKGIEDYLNETNTPMLSIGNDAKSVNTDVYCCADDEMLIRNGMQYWINEDKKSMTFRFIPQMHCISENASEDGSTGIELAANSMVFYSAVCVVAFDYNNVTRFEVSLLPRLITGDIEKNDPQEPDPVLGQGTWTTTAYNVTAKETEIISHPLPDSACLPGYEEAVPTDKKIHPERLNGVEVGELPRTDYEWNSSIDRDHLYVNNTDATPASAKVPLYICKSSAFISPDLMESGYNFDWTKFKSDLYDAAAGSAIDIPFTINGKPAISGFSPDSATVKLVETYQGDDEELIALNSATFNFFEIIQSIETSSKTGIVSRNQLRCRVAI